MVVLTIKTCVYKSLKSFKLEGHGRGILVVIGYVSCWIVFVQCVHKNIMPLPERRL
jgi:hypothetical protein